MKVCFGFVCDDARREDNGKLIFIGAYGVNILPNEFPAAMVLTLVAAIEVTEPFDVTTEFQASLDGKPLVSGTGRLKAGTVGMNFFPIKNIFLEMKDAGTLKFQIRLDGGDWQTACTIPVQAKPST